MWVRRKTRDEYVPRLTLTTRTIVVIFISIILTGVKIEVKCIRVVHRTCTCSASRICVFLWFLKNKIYVYTCDLLFNDTLTFVNCFF